MSYLKPFGPRVDVLECLNFLCFHWLDYQPQCSHKHHKAALVMSNFVWSIGLIFIQDLITSGSHNRACCPSSSRCCGYYPGVLSFILVFCSVVLATHFEMECPYVNCSNLITRQSTPDSSPAIGAPGHMPHWISWFRFSEIFQPRQTGWD